ncbi:fumarate hydratase C-terminal domain-containing protein [bacterium]|nr:fumarate hydratase C-terminal domain-containing protein [bacterium]
MKKVSKPRNLTTPLSQDVIASLRAGDECLITGEIIGARDQAHRLMFEMISRGEELPFELSGSIIYYVGPTQARPGQIIGSAGPTTSSRMDFCTPLLLSMGLKGMIGKGNRSEDVRRAIVKHKAVYFAAPGGLGALLGGCVVSSTVIYGEELGPEAIRLLSVEDMPVVVVNDILGGDMYEDGKLLYRKVL